MKGYEVVEHTADVGIRAWGDSMAEAFENCALGMMSLMLDAGKVRLHQRVRLSARGRDRESLLIAWLAEILFKVEAEGWAFGSFEIYELGDSALEGWGSGEPLDAARHEIEREIKSPTYHLLELEEKEGGWTAQVIFDV